MKRRVIKINPNIAQSNVKSYKPVQSRHKVHLPKTIPQSHIVVPEKPIIALKNNINPRKHSILIVLHLFHGNLVNDFLEKLLKLTDTVDFDIIVTVCKNSLAHKSKHLYNYESKLNAKIITVENVGKDIIPKLIAIEYAIKEKKQYNSVFLMHDKKSVKHTKTPNKWDRNASWKDELIDNLFNDVKRNFSIDLLCSNKNIGLVGSKKHLHYGPGWHKDLFIRRFSKELALINHQTILESQINSKIPKTAWFIGGTMFWIKWDILANFYNTYGFSKIFDLAKNDKGNIQDPSFTHYLERFFGQVTVMYNMKTVGI